MAKRGRPAKRSTRSAKPTAEAEAEEKIQVRCTICGRETMSPKGQFYKLSYSDLHRGNGHWSHICISCANDEFRKLSIRYDKKMAALILCSILNVPYYEKLFEVVDKTYGEKMTFGYYLRRINGVQFQNKTFISTVIDGMYKQREEKELIKAKQDEIDDRAETNWTVEEKRAKNEVIDLMGYDPFERYAPKVRRLLFPELLGYLDDEDLLNDTYKLSQVIQVINNNQQINSCDIAISNIDINEGVEEIKVLNQLKKELVASNEKITRENGISVKGRGEQKAGKGSLTGLMRDMRERDIEEVEVNFYNQLQSPASRWATDVSMRSMLENIELGENDVNEIIETQRELVQKYQNENESLEEDCRLLRVQQDKDSKRISELEAQVKELGGVLDG